MLKKEPIKEKITKTNVEPQQTNNEFAKVISQGELFKTIKNVLKKLKKFFLTSQTKNKPVKKKKEYYDPYYEAWSESGNITLTSNSIVVICILLAMVMYPFGHGSDFGVPPGGNFLCLWSLSQGIAFLMGLIFYSGISRFCYNKGLSDLGGGINSKKGMGLLLITLGVHSALGVAAMRHRDTFLGTFMFAHPLATLCSIFILLLVCFYSYHRFYKYKKN